MELEAPSGFEPLNDGFADRSLNHLGTAPRGRQILPVGMSDAMPLCAASVVSPSLLSLALSLAAVRVLAFAAHWFACARLYPSLTALGNVEIVSDYPSPHVVLAATGDAGTLRKVLEDLARRAFGHQEVQQHRKFYELGNFRAGIPGGQRALP